MMLESIFYLRFLTQQNEPQLFLAFQRYGIGQEKLYKMQLRRLLDEGKLKDSPAVREFIDSDSDEEIADELVNVRLKNFEDIRKLATDTGMKDDYVLSYQPQSTIVHGQWPALRQFYLKTCVEPLHRQHLQPTFVLPPLDPQMIVTAFNLFVEGYSTWAKRYGFDDLVSVHVSRYFDCSSGLSETIRQAGANNRLAQKGSNWSAWPRVFRITTKTDLKSEI